MSNDRFLLLVEALFTYGADRLSDLNESRGTDLKAVELEGLKNLLVGIVKE